MGDSTVTSRIDGVMTSLAVKAPVACATAGPITLYGLQVIDGVVLTATVPVTRVLVKDQADSRFNGIYDVSTTSWLRSVDFDGAYDAANGTTVFVVGATGSASNMVFYRLKATDLVVFGTSALVFELLGTSSITLPLEVQTSDHAGDVVIANAAAVLLGRGLVVNTASALTGATNITATYVRFAGGYIDLGNYNLSVKLVVADDQQAIFRANGSGDVTLNFNTRIPMRWFSASKTGTVDDTNAAKKTYKCAKLSRAALTASMGNGSAQGTPPGVQVVWPDGGILITDEVLCDDQYTASVGSFMGTNVIFRPTTAKTCLRLQKTGGQMVQCPVTDLKFWTDNPHDVPVLALNGFDLDTGAIQRVFVSGSYAGALGNYWHDSTGSSKGIVINGRDQLTIDRCEVQADWPIYIAANPNTLPAENEESNLFWITNAVLLGLGHHSITVADGYGVQNLTIGPNITSDGGLGLFKMNDTRVSSPSLIASGPIRFMGIEIEQQDDGTQYAIDIQSTVAIGSIDFIGAFIAKGGDANPAHGSNGIRIATVTKCLFRDVTTAMAAGKYSLNLDGGNSLSSITMDGARWQLNSLMRLDGYFALSGGTWNRMQWAAPSDAIYVWNGGGDSKDFTIHGDASDEPMLVWKLSWTNGEKKNISNNLTTQGMKMVDVHVIVEGATKSEIGDVGVFVTLGTSKLGGASAGIAASSTASKFCVYLDSDDLTAENLLGEAVTGILVGRGRGA